MLSRKVSGTAIGPWLLLPGLLKLGVWDVLKAWDNNPGSDLNARTALQMVSESALCINRVRKKNSLAHQGFQLFSGSGRLASDEQVHKVLDSHSMEDATNMLVNLGLQRRLCGHYQGGLISVDPHRMISSTKRSTTKKKKKADAAAHKMLQSFFSVCAQTGQPIMACISSAGMPTSLITQQLIRDTDRIINSKSLLLADKEHFTKDLFHCVHKNPNLDLLTPAINTQKVKRITGTLQYKPVSAGFAIGETDFYFDGDKTKYRIIAERLGERDCNYEYKAFLTTSNADAATLLGQEYDKRWSVEEFFRFENEIGLNRASTQNLNIRYGKLAMAMIAQSATHELRKNLKPDYRTWDAKHLASHVLAWKDGDIRVKNDTIIITFYDKSNYLNKEEYINFPQKLMQLGINPCIPWLYNLKVDFIFK